MDKAHTTPRYRAPTAMAPVFPSLIVWTLTLVAFSWWRTPHLPEGLLWVVKMFYTPRVTFLVLAAGTLLAGWRARHDRIKQVSVLGTSVTLAVIYLFLLT